MALSMYNSKSCFERGGLIAEYLEGYVERPQQIRMAEAVDKAILTKRNLIVEAGTGVGKSLAYLVPFVLWAHSTGERVVISTYTKALQNQLLVKDLPFLKESLDIDFKYAICMGAENYVCLRKANNNSAVDIFSSAKRLEEVDRVLEWVSQTKTGLVTDMDFMPDRSVWKHFSRESDLCVGKKCHYSDECYYRRSKIKQQEAQVLISNHSLLFADLVSEAQVLPDYEALVLDEAHTLEDVATRHFGKEISNGGIRYVLDGIADLVMLGKSGVSSKLDKAKQWLTEAESASKRFFEEVEKSFGDEERTFEFERELDVDIDLAGSFSQLAEALSRVSDEIKDPEMEEEAKAYSRRCAHISETADFIFNSYPEGYVFWASVKKRKGRLNYSFNAAPIDISEMMREYLFSRVAPCVLTSATLSASGNNNDFSFVKKRLGLDEPMELALDSPFDQKKNVLLYTPEGIADPNARFATYRQQVTEHIIRIYDIMGGRIFVLFTSYDMMNKVACEIAKTRIDINMLKQGDLPRYVLLDVFKKSEDTMLMGTATFWQGVDVPGSALECVIITKLPFTVPSDPVNAARIKALRDKGLNPFNEYQVPQAVIMFRQGIGRLIRSHSDRGVVAVLDPRVTTRYYGKEFIRPLEACSRTRDIEDVKAFFDQTHTAD